MDWLNHPLTKHPLTIILVVAVVVVAFYFAFSPYQICMRANYAEWRDHETRSGECQYRNRW